MDNNALSSQQPVETTEQIPTAISQPVPAVPAIATSPTEGGGKRVLLFVFLGIIIIVLAVGGVYYYLNFLQTPKSTESPSVSQNKASSGSDVAGVSTIEAELDAVNINSLDDAMTEIDQDISSL